jgi:hypothetical protein
MILFLGETKRFRLLCRVYRTGCAAAGDEAPNAMTRTSAPSANAATMMARAPGNRVTLATS